MRKPILLTVALPVMLVAILWSASFANAQGDRPLQEQVVGTWTLVSEVAYKGDQTSMPLGPNPQGQMMFDRNGRFMMIIARPDLPKFAGGKRDAGTPEENKAVLAGLLGFFGTYSTDESAHVLLIRPQAGTFPNWNGADQKRFCVMTVDEMKWTNRTPAIAGEYVEVLWRRVR
jgi:Lipocalin-like domain